MKKSTLFMACCIGLMLFASCKKDPVAPTINIYEGEGCVAENAQVYSGTEILVGFTGSGENLTNIEVVLFQDGTVLANHSESFNSQKKDNPLPTFTYQHAFTIEATGIVTITGTVTDANGLTASKSFNINYNEKPNAKFVGHYEGNALLTGSNLIEVTGMEPMQEDFTDRPIAVILDLAAGENMNEVIATCMINDRTMTATGIVDGNTATFEATDEVVTLDYDFNGTVLHPEITINYTINTTIEDDQLMLDGNLNGSGTFNFLFFNGTITMNDTIGGSLNKIQ